MAAVVAALCMTLRHDRHRRVHVCFRGYGSGRLDDGRIEVAPAEDKQTNRLLDSGSLERLD